MHISQTILNVLMSTWFTSEPQREPPVQCTTDGECPSKLACFSGHCENPCQIIQPCGVNAKCSVIDTLPYRTMICECLPGFTGDAYKECVPRKFCGRGWMCNDYAIYK